MKNNFILLILILVTFPHLSTSQNSVTNKLQYEVRRVYPPISITKEKLNEANTLIDLNTRYKASWVRKYISVETMASLKGKIKRVMSQNDILSQEQKKLINSADIGTDISVKVRYLPENTLKHNDIKEVDFTFTVDPESQAKYFGGEEQLKQYLKENAIDKIPEGSFKDYDLTAVKFTINEDGEIINPHAFESVFQPYKNEKVDHLLLEAIRNMPCWKPAEYSNGTKVKQEFVLIVGNMESCVINLLNTRKDWLAKNE